MGETRRLKMKIGDAEFEADVPESIVQPMYNRFLSMLERRRTPLFWPFDTTSSAHKKTPEIEEAVRGSVEEVVRSGASMVHGETCDQAFLTQVFDLRQDGVVILKVLPKGGPDQHADALLLLLYGYYRLKNEERVMATVLNRAAEQSGIPVPRLANGYARNGRYVVRGGYGKGSNYSLNSEGLAVAKEIVASIFELCERAAPQFAEDGGRYREGAIVSDASPVAHHSPLFQ